MSHSNNKNTNNLKHNNSSSSSSSPLLFHNIPIIKRIALFHCSNSHFNNIVPFSHITTSFREAIFDYHGFNEVMEPAIKQHLLTNHNVNLQSRIVSSSNSDISHPLQRILWKPTGRHDIPETPIIRLILPQLLRYQPNYMTKEELEEVALKLFGIRNFRDSQTAFSVLSIAANHIFQSRLEVIMEFLIEEKEKTNNSENYNATLLLKQINHPKETIYEPVCWAKEPPYIQHFLLMEYTGHQNQLSRVQYIVDSLARLGMLQDQLLLTAPPPSSSQHRYAWSNHTAFSDALRLQPVCNLDYILQAAERHCGSDFVRDKILLRATGKDADAAADDDDGSTTERNTNIPLRLVFDDASTRMSGSSIDRPLEALIPWYLKYDTLFEELVLEKDAAGIRLASIRGGSIGPMQNAVSIFGFLYDCIERGLKRLKDENHPNFQKYPERSAHDIMTRMMQQTHPVNNMSVLMMVVVLNQYFEAKALGSLLNDLMSPKKLNILDSELTRTLPQTGQTLLHLLFVQNRVDVKLNEIIKSIHLHYPNHSNNNDNNDNGARASSSSSTSSSSTTRTMSAYNFWKHLLMIQDTTPEGGNTPLHVAADWNTAMIALACCKDQNDVDAVLQVQNTKNKQSVAHALRARFAKKQGQKIIEDTGNTWKLCREACKNRFGKKWKFV